MMTAIPAENVVPLPRLVRGMVRGIHADEKREASTSLSLDLSIHPREQVVGGTTGLRSIYSVFA